MNYALIFSCYKGYLNPSKLLIKLGADISSHKSAALQTACYSDNFELVTYLVEHGAKLQSDPDADNDTFSVLSFAIDIYLDDEYRGDNTYRIINYLLDHGADANDDNVLFSLENSRFDKDLIEILINKGLDIHKDNERLLEHICFEANLKYVMYLVEKHDFNINKESVMYYAICGGSLEIIKYLVLKGVDPKYGNNRAISEAAYHGHLEMMQYFMTFYENDKLKPILEHIAEYSICGYDHGYMNILQYLKSLNVDIHTDHEAGLRRACEYGHYDIVKYIIDDGADINAYFNGPLYEAMKGYYDMIKRKKSTEEHMKIIKLLLDKEAKVNGFCEQIFNQAITNNDLDMLQLLIDHGGHLTVDYLLNRTSGNNPKTIDYLLKHAIDNDNE